METTQILDYPGLCEYNMLIKAFANKLKINISDKNVIKTKLAEAKSYADSINTIVKNELFNGVAEACDTLKEICNFIDDSVNKKTVTNSNANVNHNYDDKLCTKVKINNKFTKVNDTTETIIVSLGSEIIAMCSS